MVATEDMYNLLIELAKIPSVSPGVEEKRIAETIYCKLSSEPYFQANPAFLRLLPVKGDPLGRQSVFAMVRAVPDTPKTVIMIGHMDVVETHEARGLAEMAFDPHEYTRQLSRLTLPDDVRRDLESGHYLFGRGVFDMKCGVAAETDLLREMSRSPKSLQANLILLLVCDEENQSAGMISAVEYLMDICHDENLELVACVNAEGEIQDNPDDRYVSLGTIGKMMPVFYCVGRETHIGSYYEGLNANLLASAVNMVFEGSPQWAEDVGPYVYPPPAALKHRDLRDVYSVTLPARAVVYFSYHTVTKTPAAALEMMKAVAQQGFVMALERLRHGAEECAARSSTQISVPWSPKVITYEELVASASSSFSTEFSKDRSFDDHLDRFMDSLPKEMDDRDKSIAVIGEVLRYYTDKDPVIVVGFLPPFYPHKTNLRKSQREIGLVRAVEELIAEAKSQYNENLVLTEHFTAISDLSYMGFQGSRQDFLPLAKNTPGWGKIYSLPLEALFEMEVPVVNLGPSGQDAHKYTERLDLRYYLGAYPGLLKSLVKRLSELE
jgi:arginine utilization protein RocB